MAMNPSDLANALALNPNVGAEADAINNFVTAWITYFSAATAGLVPIVSPLLSTPPIGSPKSAMIAAMTGLSVGGAASITSGIVAFWAAMIPLATTLFPTATLIMPPPTLATLAAELLLIFPVNTAGSLTAAASYNSIASAIHLLNIAGGTATLLIAGVPTPTPIL